MKVFKNFGFGMLGISYDFVSWIVLVFGLEKCLGELEKLIEMFEEYYVKIDLVILLGSDG